MNIPKSCKTVIIGPSMVGKTSIAIRLEGGDFLYNTENTIGCSFIRVRTDTALFDVWDTAGQERYMSIGPMYYRNANIVIFVYDVSGEEGCGLENMTKFIKYFYKTYKENELCKIIIVANKIDLDTNLNIPNIISTYKTHPIIQHFGLDTIEPIFVSAKNNIGINILLDTMVKYSESINPIPQYNIVNLENDSINYCPYFWKCG